MQKTKQLTYEERIQIEPLDKRGLGPTGIGLIIGRDKSVVSRELRRNRRADGVYCAVHAVKRALTRRARAPGKIKGDTRAQVEDALRDGRSPYEITAMLPEAQRVSTPAIYDHIERDADAGGCLHLHLYSRRARRRPRNKGKSKRRGPIPNRRGIEQRPAEVEARLTYGHWEGDSVHGAGPRGGYLVTLVERLSRYLVTFAVPSLRADNIAKGIAAAMRGLLVKTITFDNGGEFARHEKLSTALECDCFFANPGTPSERGTNENTNRMLRRFFPKRVAKFRHMRKEEVRCARERINRKLRRSLGGLSANDHLRHLVTNRELFLASDR